VDGATVGLIDGAVLGEVLGTEVTTKGSTVVAAEKDVNCNEWIIQHRL
jgi:hypothetical protein